MMKKTILCLATTFAMTPILAYAESSYFSIQNGEKFKRFSISAGWLHAMPQGKANPVNVNTAVKNASYTVGDVQLNTVSNAIEKSSEGDTAKAKLHSVAALGSAVGLVKNGLLTANMTGNAEINSLEHWDNPNAGLEADAVDTLAIMANYHFTEHWSLEIKAGIPPKVDIQGIGKVDAPLVGIATPKGNVGGLIGIGANPLIDSIGAIPLDTLLPITNLEQGHKAASTRAWLPAAEIHYQFGQSGIHKFRPYVGLGVIYAYFDKIELNSGIQSDLVNAGHMIQNVLDGKAGAALDRKTSSANPEVKVKAKDAFAPIATIGATYDFNQNWFAVGSVSYAKLNSEAEIQVLNKNTNQPLINVTSKIDIDPVITYVGVGYRF